MEFVELQHVPSLRKVNVRVFIYLGAQSFGSHYRALTCKTNTRIRNDYEIQYQMNQYQYHITKCKSINILVAFIPNERIVSEVNISEGSLPLASAIDVGERNPPAVSSLPVRGIRDWARGRATI